MSQYGHERTVREMASTVSGHPLAHLLPSLPTGVLDAPLGTSTWRAFVDSHNPPFVYWMPVVASRRFFVLLREDIVRRILLSAALMQFLFTRHRRVHCYVGCGGGVANGGAEGPVDV